MLSFLYLITSFILSVWFMAEEDIFAKPYSIVVLFLLTSIGYVLFFGLQLLIFALFGFTIDVNHLPKSIHNIYRKIGFDILKVFLDSLKVRVHTSGMEQIPKGKFMLVSNHLTIFDPMVHLLLFKKHDLAFVSKQENMKIPFVGRYMAAVGCIPLDRDDTKSALKSINLAADSITSGKANMGIFPEGRVNKSDEPLLPFRNGAFKIAKKADVPILVVTIRGTNKVKHQIIRRRTHVYVDALEVIPEEEVKQMKTGELSDRCRAIMQEHLVRQEKNA